MAEPVLGSVTGLTPLKWLRLFSGRSHPQLANAIAAKLGRRRIHTLPEPLVKLGARVGDGLGKLGVRAPLTSFRLANMRADTSGGPLENVRALADPLPFTLAQGVEATITWMRQQGMIQ